MLKVLLALILLLPMMVDRGYAASEINGHESDFTKFLKMFQINIEGYMGFLSTSAPFNRINQKTNDWVLNPYVDGFYLEGKVHKYILAIEYWDSSTKEMTIGKKNGESIVSQEMKYKSQFVSLPIIYQGYLSKTLYLDFGFALDGFSQSIMVGKKKSNFRLNDIPLVIGIEYKHEYLWPYLIVRAGLGDEIKMQAIESEVVSPTNEDSKEKKSDINEEIFNSDYVFDSSNYFVVKSGIKLKLKRWMFSLSFLLHHFTLTLKNGFDEDGKVHSGQSTAYLSKNFRHQAINFLGRFGVGLYW